MPQKPGQWPELSSPGRTAIPSLNLLPLSSRGSPRAVLQLACALPRVSLSLSSLSGSTPGNSSGGGAGVGSDVVKVLAELLLRQQGGRAFVIEQLEQLEGSQAAAPLQLEVSVSVSSSEACWTLCFTRQLNQLRTAVSLLLRAISTALAHALLEDVTLRRATQVSRESTSGG